MHATSQPEIGAGAPAAASPARPAPSRAWPPLGLLLSAAASLLLVLMLHAGLLVYLAGVRFPALWLRRHGGVMAPSMFCSALVHAALLVALAAWALEIARPPVDLGRWLQAAEDAAEAGPEFEIPALTAATEKDVRESASSASASQVATLGAQVQGAFGAEATETEWWQTAAPAGGSRIGGGGITGLGAGDDLDGGFGKELGRELGAAQSAKKGKANFFGISASGNSFVFVVDKSGSMQGSRFRRARNELRRSIEALEDRQSYFIIFFDVAALPMPSQGLLAATPRNNRDVFRWLPKVEAVGNTNPLPAVMQALEMKPDAIFLLTDGDFPKVMADHIVTFQGGGVPIHTIGFENAAGELVLNSISARTGGTYRFVK